MANCQKGRKEKWLLKTSYPEKNRGEKFRQGDFGEASGWSERISHNEEKRDEKEGMGAFVKKVISQLRGISKKKGVNKEKPTPVSSLRSVEKEITSGRSSSPSAEEFYTRKGIKREKIGSLLILQNET